MGCNHCSYLFFEGHDRRLALMSNLKGGGVTSIMKKLTIPSQIKAWMVFIGGFWEHNSRTVTIVPLNHRHSPHNLSTSPPTMFQLDRALWTGSLSTATRRARGNAAAMRQAAEGTWMRSGVASRKVARGSLEPRGVGARVDRMSGMI